MANTRWTVAEAKSKFSEVLERAEKEGPQRITKHGKETAVVISAGDWERRKVRKGNLAEFFNSSPLRDSKLRIERENEMPRELEL